MKKWIITGIASFVCAMALSSTVFALDNDDNGVMNRNDNNTNYTRIANPDDRGNDVDYGWLGLAGLLGLLGLRRRDDRK